MTNPTNQAQAQEDAAPHATGGLLPDELFLFGEGLPQLTVTAPTERKTIREVFEHVGGHWTGSDSLCPTFGSAEALRIYTIKMQRDAVQATLAAKTAAPSPEWGRVSTVGDMVRNLLTLDQGTPIFTAYHVDVGGQRRCRTRSVTISRERVVDGKWVDSARRDVPYAHVIWAKPDQGSTQAQRGQEASGEMLEILGRVHPYAMPVEDFKRAEERLQRAVDLQQPLPVPDQAAIVWRGDLMRLIDELQHKRSVWLDWKRMRAAAEAKQPNGVGSGSEKP